MIKVVVTILKLLPVPIYDQYRKQRLAGVQYSNTYKLNTQFLTTDDILREQYNYYFSSIREETYYESIITLSDKLFAAGKYKELYNMLNKTEYQWNIDILWRLCRVLLQMSSQTDLYTENQRIKMVGEAYNIITTALDKTKTNANVHKWYAVTLCAKDSFKACFNRFHNLPEIKEHLTKATKLGAPDVATLYQLGKLCYETADLSCFQRKLCSALNISVPKSSFKEAYRYFTKIEEMHPRKHIMNVYMLAMTSYKLGYYYRAKYYFDIACFLPAKNAVEKKCIEDATHFSKKLHKYNINKHALLGKWTKS